MENPETGLRITVDDREHVSGLAAAISRRWEPVFVGRLPVGDVEIGPRVLVERKTVADFVCSLERGRLFRQIAALSQAAYRPLLVVEGEDAFAAHVLEPHSLRGVLLAIMTGFRVPVLRTGSVEDTAVHLAHVARQEVKRASRRRGAGRGPTQARAAIDVLGAIPGVGDHRARRLLESFGSVRAVFEAEEEDLTDVPGVGRSTARALRQAGEDGPDPARE